MEVMQSMGIWMLFGLVWGAEIRARQVLETENPEAIILGGLLNGKRINITWVPGSHTYTYM